LRTSLTGLVDWDPSALRRKHGFKHSRVLAEKQGREGYADDKHKLESAKSNLPPSARRLAEPPKPVARE
jgi:hypothetical protein